MVSANSVFIETEGELSQQKSGPARSTRDRFTYKRKLEIIQQVSELQAQASGKKRSRNVAVAIVSSETGIAAGTISNWMKNQNHIRDSAGTGDVGNTKNRYNRLWLRDLRYLEEVLARDIRKRRKLGLCNLIACLVFYEMLGLKVGRTWTLTRARQLRRMPGIVKPENMDHIQLSYTWYYQGFLPRQEFSIRRGNNRKKADTHSLKPLIYHFHQSLKERNNGRQLQPTSIFNFDEVISSVGFGLLTVERFPFRLSTTATGGRLMILERRGFGSDSLAVD